MDAYRAPQSTLKREPVAKRKMLGRIFAWMSIGAILILPGIYFTWAQFITLYFEIQSNSLTVSSPKEMAALISQNLVPVALSSMVAFPSLICVFLSITFSNYRSRIFFRFWVFLAIAWIVAIPIGTPFGLILALTLFLTRKGFRKNKK